VNLSDVSIRRPVFAAMLIGALVVLGMVSVTRLEMQLDPDIEFPFATVSTLLPGASPETVEKEVTDVLEEHINAIEGVRSLRSSSTQGLSRIGVEFSIGYDIDAKVQEVRDRVALARPALPEDVEEPVVGKFDLNAIPVMNVVLGGPLSLRELSDLAEHEVVERLERLPGVGAVRVVGAREREIRIWLDPLRLAGFGVAAEDVAAVLRRENAELAGGRIVGSDREWSVTTQGKARRVDELGELVVANRGGRPIRLRDVALVEDGMAEATTVARLDGRPGVALEIQRQSGADLVALARAVRAEVEALRERLPAGTTLAISRDYAEVIEEQVASIFRDMVVAVALVVAVVLFFLRSGRTTAIASLSIPASVVASFIFFYAFDLSLNIMTLTALSLAIGLVIDDSIVVLESIYRRIERGIGAIEAAHEGAREVGLAVISTTLAVCAVFVPIAFMQSTVGRYFYEFGVGVTVAVCTSTLVALTLAPMLASRFLRPQTDPGRLFRSFEAVLHALEGAYRRLLQAALRHRAVTVGVAILSVAGGIALGGLLPIDLYTEEDVNEAEVHIELPVGTPLHVTDRALRRAEAAVLGHPEVRHVFAVAGREIRHEPHTARMEIALTPKQQREEPVAFLFAELREAIGAAVPEAEEISVGFPAYGSSEGEFAGLSYGLRGPDLEELRLLAERLTLRMRSDPAFADVATSFETGRPQVTLAVERGRAADLGVSAADIGRTLRMLLAGQTVGSFESAGRRYDVRLQVLPEYRDDPDRLALVRIRNRAGELVPLPNVVTLRLESGPVEIQREDRSRQVRITANMAPGVTLGEGAARIEAWSRELGVAPPVELVPGGRARMMEETAADIQFAFGLGLLALYMVLASLFDSLVHPLTIMMSAPLSFVGGFAALYLLGMSLDMMSGVGMLVLMGLVMKNGILLVDYTNQLRARGHSRQQALLEAGPVRMRPVLMTSGALVFGMVPMLVAESIGSEFRAPMAAITMGGLVTSTLLTLVVVPVVYDLIDAGQERLRAALARLAPRRRRPRARPEAAGEAAPRAREGV